MSQSVKKLRTFRARSEALLWVFSPLASLRLTVTLFAFSIFIILVGTLAQTQKNMWDVRADYFHTWWTWIELQVFSRRHGFPIGNRSEADFIFPVEK